MSDSEQNRRARHQGNNAERALQSYQRAETYAQQPHGLRQVLRSNRRNPKHNRDNSQHIGQQPMMELNRALAMSQSRRNRRAEYSRAGACREDAWR